ncbi:MAG TPA: M23 family metallopeptidase [Lachnospiraceae bacterium]|nr:M23 family metallopeptidase [Lachnospiraceae bacterium]HPF28917.1 M23 family metallopeptidase [Lachnospiraceae bacterium]
MRRKQKPGLRKERIIMLAASVFVLTALTMTGVYVNQKNTKENDGYSIDLNELDTRVGEQAEQIGEQLNDLTGNATLDDLDVEINYEEVNTGDAMLPQEDLDALRENSTRQAQPSAEVITRRDAELRQESIEEAAQPGESLNEAVNETGIASSPELVLNFTENDFLAWPIVGNVILNYSIDKIVYFATLNQYRYNPSIVIEAVLGEPITAAANAQIISIENDVETGGTIVLSLGNGYELTYGQLENFTVEVGDYVERGDILGFVAEPSIFYSLEGSNVYFKLTKDGLPLDPLTIME